MSGRSGPITQLNNYLQEKFHDTSCVSYTERYSGTAWVFECKVYGEVKGTGSAKTKTEAKEIAATRALNWFKNSE